MARPVLFLKACRSEKGPVETALEQLNRFYIVLATAKRIKYCFIWLVGWLVGCFGFNGPLRQYFSLYWAVSQKREKEERKDR